RLPAPEDRTRRSAQAHPYAAGPRLRPGSAGVIRSLRARLFLGSAVTTVAILATFNVILYTLIQSSVLSDFDESLTAKARAVSVLIEEGNGTYGLDYDQQFFPEFETNHHEFYEFWL